MDILKILILINYIYAVVLLLKITNDDTWSEILSDILSFKDFDEQQEFMANHDMYRKTFCYILIIPGVGLIALILNLIKKL